MLERQKSGQVPNGENLRLQIRVLFLQLLHLLLHFSGSHRHHLISSHNSSLQLFLQRIFLLLQSGRTTKRVFADRKLKITATAQQTTEGHENKTFTPDFTIIRTEIIVYTLIVK